MMGSDTGQGATRRKLLLFAALTLLAYAGNVVTLHMFFNVAFVFGSIFWMLSIVLCGPALGMLSAVIASAQSYITWHSPYTVFTFISEAAFVAIIYSRRGGSLLLLDAIFWIALGIPMGLGMHMLNLDVSHSAVYVIVLKQAINGIFNTLVATLALSVAYRIPWVTGHAPVRRGRSMHEMLFAVMAAMILFPSLIGMIVTSRGSFNKMEHRVIEETLYASSHLDTTLNAWLDDHSASVRALAIYAEDPSGGSQMRNQALLSAIITASPGFERMGILNTAYRSVAFWPPSVGGRSNIGLDLSDREYITKLSALNELSFSGILSARAGPPNYVVAIASPIVRDGQLRGVALGSILSGELSKTMRAALGRKDMAATLVDSTGSVIASTEFAIEPKSAFGGIETYDATEVAKGVSRLSPREMKNAPVAEKWATSLYYTSVPLSVAPGWKLVVETPVKPYHAMLNSEALSLLYLMMAVTVVAVFGSFGLSRAAAGVINKIGEATAGLPERLERGEDVELPRSGIREVAALIENFRSMAGALNARFLELREARHTLEYKVEERTHELAEAHDMLLSVLDGMSSLVYVADMQSHEVLFMNREMKDAFGDATGRKCWASLRSGMQGPCPDCVNDRLALGAPEPVVAEILSDAGRWYEVSSRAIRWIDGRTVRLSVGMDVSERREAEQALRDSLVEKEMLIREVHHRVKNNLAVISSLLSLQSRRIEDEETRDIFNDSQSRVRSMSMIHERLYRSGDQKSIEISEYVSALAGQIGRSFDSSGTAVRFELHVPKTQMDVDTAIPCGLIINELVTNAFKHAFTGGREGVLQISLSRAEGGAYYLVVRDNGEGLPEGAASSHSLGLTIVSTLVKQLKGTMEVRAVKGSGTEFDITFYERKIG